MQSQTPSAKHCQHYRRLVVMLALFAIAMYVLMYAMLRRGDSSARLRGIAAAVKKRPENTYEPCAHA